MKTNKNKLWLVFYYSTYPEFCGIYDSREKAIKNCKNKRFYIVPVLLNKKVDNNYPYQKILFQEAYYPLAND